jgi:hypothetical protein
VITAANSLVGSTVNDEVGADEVIALADGNYVVTSATWNNGSTVDAGAVTWGNGTTGITGEVTRDNSIVSWAATTGLQLPVRDGVNGTFISPFLTEGGGRIRVGPVTPLVIASALDIPGDQGGWLRLTFGRSYLDHVYGSPPVTSYGVWRHVPGTFASRLLVGAAGALPIEADATFPPGTWELVQSVPAIQQDQYVVAVPTISNAAANDYLVTAHTVTPSIWFISPSASGQSLDNTPPAQPTNFTAAYSGDQTHLQWAANIEADLSSYSLYRGVSADFVPAIGNRIASLDATSYADVGPAGGYYKLSAVDVNGNESSHALITPQNTLDAPGADTHVAFALEGVQPNPAGRRSLRVAFALPHAAPARLELLDMSGRRVLARDVGSLGAGRHTVNLAEGRVLPAGIYWVSLRQGLNRRTARVAVIE